MKDTFWKHFEKTGDINSYLQYKKIRDKANDEVELAEEITKE